MGCTSTLVKLIQAYGKALEKDQQASQNDMPFYELDLPDEELIPLKQEPMDIEMEPAEDNLFENNANNVSTNIIKKHARENVSIS